MDTYIESIARRLLHLKPKDHKLVPPPTNWGTNYPEDYLRYTFDIYVRSNFECWPNGLGYDDQDPSLVDDYQVLLADLDYQMAFLEDQQKSGKEGSKDKPKQPPTPKDFNDL